MESNKEISVRLGVMWKNLNSDAKETYYSASRKADEDHKRKYPGYYYSPKEARIRKTLKLSRRVSPTAPNMDAVHLVKVYMSSEDNRNEQTCPIILSKSMKKHRSILPKPDGQSTDTMDIDDDEIRVETDDEDDEDDKFENGEEFMKSE